MPEIIEVLRKAHAEVNRDSATHKIDAAIQDAQRKAQPHSADIFALPCDLSQWFPLQDTDPESGTYGLFYDLTGYSIEGQDAARPGG